jgi:DNA excision repair protein ERCC-4
MYQPMTDLMRQCQDAITECMEAMLVELKRDHSLVSRVVMAWQFALSHPLAQNLDLEDINVRNAQFKNFDTIVRMRLKPVWHKVGAKTKIHVSALTELRNLHTSVHRANTDGRCLSGSRTRPLDRSCFLDAH